MRTIARKLGKMYVEVGLNTTNFDKQMKALQKSFTTMGQSLKKAGEGLTAAVTVPLLGIGVAASKVAMEAVESENLFSVSMGKMADSARAWSEETAKALKLNAYELRKNVGLYYTMMESMGLNSDEAYEMSKSLTQLAYDMASFYNIKPEEAFEKLRSGITGEIEPLKALGILVNDTTVKQVAYANGIAKTGDALTEQQKVQARYVAIMQQTSKAQGDMARTLDSPTNKLRGMGEQAKQAGINLGMGLMPVVEDLLAIGNNLATQLGEWAKGFAALDESTRKTYITWGLAAAAAGPLLVALGSIVTAAGQVAGAIRGIGTALTWLSAHPVVAAIAAIGTLAVGVYAYTQSQKAAEEETYRQSKAIVALSNQYNSLNETMNDASLSEEERALAAEQNKQVIQEIGRLMPQAVSLWDAHGNAVAIDTARLNENTAAALENAKAHEKQRVSEMEGRIRELEQKRKDLLTQLDAAEKNNMSTAMKGLFNAGGEFRLGDSANGFFTKSPEGVKQDIKVVEDQIASLNGEIWKLTSSMYGNHSLDTPAWMRGATKSADEATDAMTDFAASVTEVAEATGNAAEYLDDFTTAFERTADEQETILERALEDQTRAKKAAYDTQVRLLKKMHDSETASMKKRHDEAMKLLEDEYARRVGAVQKQIDAIKAQEKAEEQADAQAEAARKVAAAQRELALAQEAADPFAVAAAQVALNKALDEQQKVLTEQTRANEIDRLEGVKDALEAEHEQRRVALEAIQELELTKLAERQEANKLALETMHEQEMVAWNRAQEDMRERYAVELEDLKSSFSDKLALQADFLANWNSMAAKMSALSGLGSQLNAQSAMLSKSLPMGNVATKTVDMSGVINNAVLGTLAALKPVEAILTVGGQAFGSAVLDVFGGLRQAVRQG